MIKSLGDIRLGDLIVPTELFLARHKLAMRYRHIDFSKPFQILAISNTQALSKNQGFYLKDIEKIITKEENPEYWL